MKPLLFLSLLAAGLCGASLLGAQDPAATTFPAARRQQALRQARMHIIAQKLGLTDAQKAQVKQMRATALESVKAIRANPALTPEQKREQITALSKASREQWRAQLTPGQQAKLGEITRHPGQLKALALRRVRMAAVARQLSLTPGQRTQLHAIQGKAAAAVRPIRGDATLTPEQKQAKLREIRQSSRQEIMGVLTPEQQARLQQMRQHLLGPLG